MQKILSKLQVHKPYFSILTSTPKERKRFGTNQSSTIKSDLKLRISAGSYMPELHTEIDTADNKHNTISTDSFIKQNIVL